MEETVLMDELHVRIFVPADLPGADADAVRRLVAGDEFSARFRQAALTVIESFPALAPARLTVTR